MRPEPSVSRIACLTSIVVMLFFVSLAAVLLGSRPPAAPVTEAPGGTAQPGTVVSTVLGQAPQPGPTVVSARTPRSPSATRQPSTMPVVDPLVAGQPPATPARLAGSSVSPTGKNAEELSESIVGAGVSSSNHQAIAEFVLGTGTGASLDFSPKGIQVPANTAIRLTFRNMSTIGHNVTFEQGVAARTIENLEGGWSETIYFTTPAAGNYRFYCRFHGSMEGTLAVK